ncbi:BadF/BadG/BcrA/BcrD ATPase family protein [Kribbella sp. GL6]|uniref:BadF/BadG/BcrA/BcrD ATPase family protein n=1 Tax=Kribbella sp. GL6 TaxID=3419765 RepID=UPI003D044EC6
MSTIVVDVGKSGLRLRIRPGTAGLDSARTATVAGLDPARAALPGAGTELAAAVAAAWTSLSADACADAVETVVIGSTFIPQPWALADCEDRFRELWPSAEIVIVTDGALAHAAALGRVGTVASIGTGTVVLGLDAGGTLRQKDGWGPDLGDRGSALDLGRSGFQEACAALDGVACDTALVSLAERALGTPIDIPAAARLLAAPDRVPRLAAFATEICQAALDGDGTARALVRTAARWVADTCAAMAAEVGDTTVVTVGRLAGTPGYRQPLTEELSARGLVVQQPAASVLDVDSTLLAGPEYRRTAVFRAVTATRR